MSNHGGKRDNAGRPKGSPSRRTLAEVEAVAALYPNWSPLKHFAYVANDETLADEIRLDAAKAAAPYLHARLKQIDADPAALVKLEEQLARARMRGSIKEVVETGPDLLLAERLDRGFERIAEMERTEVQKLRDENRELQERLNSLASPAVVVAAVEAPKIEPKHETLAMPPKISPVSWRPAYKQILPYPDDLRPALAVTDYDPI
ncbi:MAG: hypothetical protein LCH46_07250 [Proteobacteria bacterium]|nr:hypothetical protein [Pseudomonadota bacterium]